MNMTPMQWEILLRLVLKRAELTKDRRVEGIRKALLTGQSEKYLRGLSILSEVDLNREMPLKTS